MGIEIISKTHIDDIGNLFFDVTLKEGDCITEKRLSVDDYLALFQDNTNEREELREVPILPPEIVRAKVSPKNESSFEAVIIYPAEKRAFSFMEEQMFIPFPALAAFVKVVDGVRKETKIRCLKKAYAGEKDPALYYYPFGNVGSAGNCCYGNIAVTGVKDVLAAPSVLDQFLYGKTNGDLWQDTFTKSGCETQAELIEKLKEMEEFPDSWLSGCNQHLSKLML